MATQYSTDRERQLAEELEKTLEDLKDINPRLYNEYKCFAYIRDKYAEEIAIVSFQCPPERIIHVRVIPQDIDGGSSKIEFGHTPLENIKSYLSQSYGEDLVDSLLKQAPPLKMVYCDWDWSIAENPKDIERQPRWHVTKIVPPFRWESPKGEPPHCTQTKTPKPPVKKEKDLEKDLLRWLHSRGVKADNQVATNNHRMDIWLPGTAFLELKRGRVTGDDVCQAIDYCTEYKKPVVLVGNHISTMASRGVEAFNKAVDGEMLVFVSWSAVKTYLKGLLGLA